MSYERKVMVKHSIASVVALALFGASRFIYSVIVSRRYGVETLGSANSLISQAFLMAIPLSFFAVALGKYGAEFLGRGDERGIKSIATVGLSFPLVGLVLLPLNFYGVFIAVLRALQLTLRSLLYGLHRGEVYAYSVAVGFLAFLLGFTMGNVYSPYLGLLGGISVFGIAYLVRQGSLGRPRREDIRLLTGYSSIAFLGTLSGVFLVQGPYFMTEKLAGSVEAGIVSASLSAAFMLTYLPQVLQSAIMPLYAYRYGKNDLEYVRLLAEKATAILGVVIALITFAGLLLGREVLTYLFGFSIGEEFYIALLAIELYVAYNPAIVALSSTRYVAEGTTASIFGVALSLFLWFLLVPATGAYGAMLGLLAGYGLIFGVVMLFARSRLGVRAFVYRPVIIALPLQALVFLSRYSLIPAVIVYVLLVRGELLGAWRSLRGQF
ncbi:lipopolysaccharide biosynthesis protein [Palaeococcus ferrophilus]|uniref:lipopolysaccharide biosynthesis protein n=1 Tax=Palaeococcus ferrophilus TaxID=83868 RepID=UPI00064F5798|nr:hypothetical protein [Palaeococcus ferrophilus]